MRSRKTRNGLTAQATAGTYVVLLGWDMAAVDIVADGVLGFAVRRFRHADGERVWLPGMKTFQAVEPHPAPGVLVSSYKHPLQTFQWGDYSAAPGERYTYRVVAMTGTPGALKPGRQVELIVSTERVDLGRHAVFFNRGAVGSQEYARRFQNRPPPEVGQAAYDWLSRGLVEGLEAFIAQAGTGDELLGAFYEFKNKRIYAALKAARSRGAVVAVLYDGDDQRERNDAALAGQGMQDMTKPRQHSGGFAHNKFIVLRRGGKAREVWTGSVNLSENGLFGHSNNAHLLRDAAMAERYAAYWALLNDDKTKLATAQRAEQLTPLPGPGLRDAVVPVFSPRRTLEALDRYAALAGQAARGLFGTFAFGMNSRFASVYDQTDAVLRFALMEKKGSGRQFQQQSEQIDRIRRRPNVVVSVGHHVEINMFDRWLAELDRITADVHVLYVHTKYLLIDPLGAYPVVIVGSANFSAASTTDNDENMLIIQGNTAVADIYLGEFMRLFSHYAFRESLGFKGATSPTNALRRKYLIDSVAWIKGDRPGAGYFDAGNDRALRRTYFSGQ